jgi:hypothetical protein
LKERRGGVLFLVGREGREKKIDDYGVGGNRYAIGTGNTFGGSLWGRE